MFTQIREGGTSAERGLCGRRNDKLKSLDRLYGKRKNNKKIYKSIQGANGKTIRAKLEEEIRHTGGWRFLKQSRAAVINENAEGRVICQGDWKRDQQNFRGKRLEA